MSRRRRSSNAPRSTQRFWGSPAGIEPAEPIAPADDPTAVVSSLGPPPLGVHSGSAAHYLEAMYQKAAGVAVALAASADLLELPDADADGDADFDE
jgi:hypothetical protein